MRLFRRFSNDGREGRSRASEQRRANRTRRILLDSLEPRCLLSLGGAGSGAGVSLGPSLGKGGVGSFAATDTVTGLINASPNGSNTMMLESDGTVIMEGGGVSNQWYRLTPDANGSYTNGTWTELASSSLQRLYYGSNILNDGRILVQGGEYSGPFGLNNDTNTGEIYNPLTNAWSKIATYPQGNFGDDPTEVLPDGSVLSGYLLGPQTYLYHPTTNTWTTGGTKLNNDASDEESWVKLADNSILSYDVSSSIRTGNSTAERYIPSTNTWVATGPVPVMLSSSAVGYELGPGFLLPDGRVFYLGANGNTAYYTPTTNAWTTGPTIPNGPNLTPLAADDAPGAELPNGDILFTADTPLFKGPASLFEFDPTNNTYTDLTSLLPTNYLSGPSYVDRMLVLPTGQVLINNGYGQLEVFTPGQAALPASTPTISSIVENGDGSFTLTGTGLNGISEGAGYGDDAEMSSNYPIVNFTDSSGKVFYARTSKWSSNGVATGATPETTSFTLPVGLPANSYSVTLIANGSPSSPYTFTTPTLADSAPTIAVAAAVTPNPDPNTSASLSVLGADGLGESSLSYTWATTASPSGVALPSFSINGTNTAKNDVVTFSHAGAYTFLVTATNMAGLSTTSSVSINVTQTLTSVVITPTPINIAPNGTRQFAGTGLDQFGVSLATPPAFAWTLGSGRGTVSSTGLYTAPASGTLATVTGTAGGISSTASVYVLSAPLTTVDIGNSLIAGAAADDSNGTFTLLDAGTDIYGTSDQFRFAYTTLNGNGTLIARVVSEPNTNANTKAGVMFRNGTAVGSAEVFMAITPGAGATFEYRSATNASTTATSTGGKPAPYWVKLVRSGNLFSGYYSPDGVTWTAGGSMTVALNTTVDVGLALTSHNEVALNTTTFDHVNLATAPTLVTMASVTPNPDLGTTATLSALGNDMAGEANLTYTWSATSVPNGAPTPTYSANGTNAAKSDLVTVYRTGSYTFLVTITDSAGLSTTSSVALTVNPTFTSIAVTPSISSIPQGGTQQLNASALDQFGQALASQPTLSYTVVAGGIGGSVSSTGLYTAPTATYGTDQVSVSSGAVSATVIINVTQVQASVGLVSVAWGTSGTATLQTAADGLRLLPAGRSTDIPWLNIQQIAITLSKAETLSPADISVTGLTVANYGPVTISGSGTSYVITLAQPISLADRVTVTISNAGITTYTRRLDVLPGDVNDDGYVTAADVVTANANFNQFFLFADINGGGGIVTTADILAIRKRNGTFLPPLT